MLQKTRRSFKKPGRYLFHAVVLLNTLPALLFRFFPTMDGPAHLYNARLIRELLGGNSALAPYVVLNDFPVPNWLGHFILAAAGAVVPAFLAEKILVLS